MSIIRERILNCPGLLETMKSGDEEGTGSRELAKELWEPLRHAMVMTHQMKLIVFPLNPESRQA